MMHDACERCRQPTRERSLPNSRAREAGPQWVVLQIARMRTRMLVANSVWLFVLGWTLQGYRHLRCPRRFYEESGHQHL